MIDVSRVVALHRAAVIRWHQRDGVDNPYEGLWAVVCRQHGFNYELWHQEDIARSPEASDAEIAQVKRTIDRLNQQRNDWIEKIDDWIGQRLQELGVRADGAPLNTETPGSAIDRLSILALRIYHYEEQRERPDADAAHRRRVEGRLAICRVQLGDLAGSLQQLLDDLRAGRKRHRTYRQLKMYNDPALNPYLYGAARRRAG